MKVVETISEIRKQIKDWRKQGYSIGFVPTMGYLHEGHLSLVQKALEQNDKAVVSIFVNPMQFSPSEDLESYPRDFNRDKELLEKTGANLIFYPGAEKLYEDDFCTYVDMNRVSKELCGKSRPVHFRGVCTIVTKLFHIITPDKAYFGQKDAQQLAVIKRMVRDLNMDIEIVGCSIVREKDGLAKSSRNTYLSEEERRAALILSKAIFLGEQLVKQGERKASILKEKMKELIESEPLANIDYIEVVDANSIEKVEQLSGSVLTAIAVYIGRTRLIDNFIISI